MIILTSPAELLESASSYVLDLHARLLPSAILFHNQRHTVQCVHAAQEISEAMGMTSEDRVIVQLAAWFCNAGHIDEGGDQITKSIELFESYADSQQLDASLREQVISCLQTVSGKKDAEGIMQATLYDAYWYFLAASNHLEMCERLRAEKKSQGEVFDDLTWRDYVCELYKQPRYQTNYGRNVLEKRKQVNYYMCLSRLYGAAV